MHAMERIASLAEIEWNTSTAINLGCPRVCANSAQLVCGTAHMCIARAGPHGFPCRGFKHYLALVTQDQGDSVIPTEYTPCRYGEKRAFEGGGAPALRRLLECSSNMSPSTPPPKQCDPTCAEFLKFQKGGPESDWGHMRRPHCR